MIRRPVSSSGGAHRCPKNDKHPTIQPTFAPKTSKHRETRRHRSIYLAFIAALVLYWRQSSDPVEDNDVFQVNTLDLQASNHSISSSSETHSDSFIASSGKLSSSITILSAKKDEKCRNNAIVLLAQKKHATYGRDSYGLLIKSLSLLSKNYISLNDHSETVGRYFMTHADWRIYLKNTHFLLLKDVFLFHTGDFDHRDIEVLEPLLGSSRKGILKLVNLNDSAFWSLPPWHAKDNQSHWALSDVFPVGYRHMCRWFGVHIWLFFDQLNSQLDCHYRHL